MIRLAVRGTVAAMAMTGVRQVTTSLGLVARTPPRAVVEEAGGLLGRVPAARRTAVIELLHWSVGGTGGAAFGALPRWLRGVPLAGPLYGAAMWTLFELAVAPAIGLEERERGPGERAMLLCDHLLYGAILQGGPRPR